MNKPSYYNVRLTSVDGEHSPKDLYVDVNDGEFRIYGGWNWGPGNEIKPGPIEVLIRAKEALIAQLGSAIRAQSDAIYDAIRGIEYKIRELTTGVSLANIPNQVVVNGGFTYNEQHFYFKQITTWSKSGIWNDEQLTVKTRFEFTRAGSPLTTYTEVRMSLPKWVDYVGGRRLNELGLFAYQDAVVPYL